MGTLTHPPARDTRRWRSKASAIIFFSPERPATASRYVPTAPPLSRGSALWHCASGSSKNCEKHHCGSICEDDEIPFRGHMFGPSLDRESFHQQSTFLKSSHAPFYGRGFGAWPIRCSVCCYFAMISQSKRQQQRIFASYLYRRCNGLERNTFLPWRQQNARYSVEVISQLGIK